MTMAIPDNRLQSGFGLSVIFIYAIYGTYISSLYILVGDKGSLGSKHFLLFIIVLMVFLLSNVGKLLLIRLFESKEKLIIVLFFTYMLLRLFFADSDTQSYYVQVLITDIGTSFISGFIAFSVLHSRLPIFSSIIRKAQSTKGMVTLTLLGSFIFSACMLYYLAQFSGWTLANIFEFRTVSNDYYQEFGDLVTIGYCCLVSLQIFSFKTTNAKWFLLFTAILFMQTAIAFICLQTVNSNKSVATICLIFFLSVYLCKPHNWLIHGWKIKTRSFYALSFLFLMFLLIFIYSPQIDITKLRIYDYGQSESIFLNTSVISRWELIMDYGIEQLMEAPFFGIPMSGEIIMHSSVLSLQIMFGLVGSILFWSFTVVQLSRVFGRGGNVGLKAISLPILLVSVISSWFAWPPLCFLLGALFAHTSAAQN